VALVLALVPDLLFGSRVQGDLAAGGHEVSLLPDETRLRERLADAAAPAAQVLVVDLTDPGLDGSAIVQSLRGEGALAGLATLAFYSHVDGAAKDRAQDAGFDMIVPRSRMAREGSHLVTRLAGD
jgi:CheY-like chemotaxis protein